MRKFIPFAAVLGVASLTLTMVFTQPASSTPEDKIWICHATGSRAEPIFYTKVCQRQRSPDPMWEVFPGVVISL